jgi:hypothetical protein
MESSRAPQSNQPQSNGNAAKTVDINSLFAVFDLTGFWLADYGSHGLEILEILQKDNYLIAKKITGDVHVPAGEISFYVDTLKNGDGKIQIAERDFKNQEWVPGKIIEILDNDTFIFQWGDRELVKRKFVRIPRDSNFASHAGSFQNNI